MDTHVKVIGALQAFFGALALVGGLLMLVSGNFAAQAIEEEGDEPAVADMVRMMMGILSYALLIYGVLALVGAVGLFTLQPYGRVISLIVCGVSLINLPFGTAFGIYGLVILTRPETGALFERAPRPA